MAGAEGTKAERGVQVVETAQRGRAGGMTSEGFWIATKVKPTGFADGMRWGMKESGVKLTPR